MVIKRLFPAIFFLLFLLNTPFGFSNSDSGSKIDDLLNEAARLRSLGQRNYSIEKYEEVLKLKPNDPVILRNLGVLYFETADYSKAVDYLKKSASNDPTDAYVHFYLADSYRELHEFDSAKTEYAEALKINPDLSEAQFGLGMIAEYENNLDEAETYFRSVIQKNPRHADSFFHLGAIDYSREKTRQARDYFEQAVDSNPKMIAGHYNLGLCYAELNELEKARESFKKTIFLDPGNAQAFYQIARTYEAQGFEREARLGYEEALKLNPNYSEARERLSQISDSFEGDEESVNELRQRAQRQVPLFGGSFGSGGFKPATGLDSFRDLANPAQSTNNKAMLLQLGAQLIQGLLNSRRQQN